MKAQQVNPGVLGNGYGWVDQDAVNGQVSVDEKAAKHDDAEVDVAMWNDYALEGTSLKTCCSAEMDVALELVRKHMLLWWNQNLRCSFSKYMRTTYG